MHSVVFGGRLGIERLYNDLLDFNEGPYNAFLVRIVDPDSYKMSGASAQSQAKTLNLENKLDGLPCGKVSQTKSNQPERQAGQTSAEIAGSGTKQVKGVLPEGFFDSSQANLSVNSDKSTEEHVNQYVQHTSSETTQVKGSIPEGFFDNKEADLRARGIKPVKPDVK